jgi:hypothetical protein
MRELILLRFFSDWGASRQLWLNQQRSIRRSSAP